MRRCEKGVRTARNDAHDLRFPDRHERQFCEPARRRRRRQDRSCAHGQQLLDSVRCDRPAACGPALAICQNTLRWSWRSARSRTGRDWSPERTCWSAAAGRSQIGEDAIYGMGLMVSTRYGIPVVNHGGSLLGYKQRHDIPSGPRRGRGDPNERRHRRLAAPFSCGAGCSKCSSTANLKRLKRPRSGRAASRRHCQASRAAGGPGGCRGGRQARRLTMSPPHSARCASIRRMVRRSSTSGNGIAPSPRARMTTRPPPLF